MGVSAFEIYLRTGRRVKGIEVKFNPWHDPDNGRFTFAGTGRYFPGGGQFGGGGASGRWNDYQRLSPRNPRNHSIYVVKRGDTLSRIAALRKGLRVSDLGWLNNIRDVDSLRVGQRLMVPNQAYLDAGRRTRTDLLNLAFYVETHGGRVPPDLAQVPSIEEQLNSNWRNVRKNGYAFHIDVINRTRRANGEVTLNPEPQRSKRSQSEAGGADRRSTDDGGHFIAARFYGPRDTFNHFAQDASFNRGAYRALEDRWAKELKAGRRVFVDIIAHYEGTSSRPASLTVAWIIDGKRERKKFPNESKGE